MKLSCISVAEEDRVFNSWVEGTLLELDILSNISIINYCVVYASVIIM